MSTSGHRWLSPRCNVRSVDGYIWFPSQLTCWLLTKPWLVQHKPRPTIGRSRAVIAFAHWLTPRSTRRSSSASYVGRASVQPLTPVLKVKVPRRLCIRTCARWRRRTSRGCSRAAGGTRMARCLTRRGTRAHSRTPRGSRSPRPRKAGVVAGAKSVCGHE